MVSARKTVFGEAFSGCSFGICCLNQKLKACIIHFSECLLICINQNFTRSEKPRFWQGWKCSIAKRKTRELIWDNFDRKYGIFNTMVGWQANLLEGIHIYLQKMEVEQLQKTLLKIAKNVKEHTKGLPDLFIYDDDSYQFIEVKSPKDTLSAQQFDWLHFFNEIGIEATALKVEWIE